MPEKILITAALPYANGPLHFGHIAGAYLPSDCYARFQRFLKNDVLFISGSDEHGVAITLSAEKANRSPKDHIDIFHKVIYDFLKKLNFSFDHYSRTSSEIHKELTQKFFLDLFHNGYIDEKIEDHLYSEKDQKFLADRYVHGICPKCRFDKARGDECQKCGASYEAKDLINPKSSISENPLTLKPSKHWYLRFDKFKHELKSWLATKDWKPNVLKFVKNYVDDLKLRSITRDSKWGVPVPLKDADGKVLYVWFDAPIGYISASMEWAKKIGDENLWKKYWLDDDTKLVNFIGKDNIPFHAIFFPAMIMGQNTKYKLVDELPANEFYLLEGKQFSKSDNWYVDLDTFFTKYSVDQLRYYLAATAPETSDSSFSFKEFKQKNNTDLIGKFGNFIFRTLSFAMKNCQGKIPPIENPTETDKLFLEKIEKLAKIAKDDFNTFHLRKACQTIMELATSANVYFDSKKPWKDVKDNKISTMKTTIAISIEAIKVLAIISYPIIPKTAEIIWEMIGFETKIDQDSFDDRISTKLLSETKLKTPITLFQKIEDDEIEEQIMNLKKDANLPVKKDTNLPISKLIPNIKEDVEFEDFDKIDLRVGEILSAEKITKSKKLLKLHVNLGFETRQIVSGISEDFKLDELIGKKALFITNLKKKKIMGEISHGMLLVGEDDNILELPNFLNLQPGSQIS